jgi:hypothetical protein
VVIGDDVGDDHADDDARAAPTRQAAAVQGRSLKVLTD